MALKQQENVTTTSIERILRMTQANDALLKKIDLQLEKLSKTVDGIKSRLEGNKNG